MGWLSTNWMRLQWYKILTLDKGCALVITKQNILLLRPRVYPLINMTNPRMFPRKKDWYFKKVVLNVM